MAWRLIGDKPSSEPMLTRFADAYMYICGTMGRWVDYALTYILMPHNICIYLIFMSQIVLYFLHSTVVLSFYINVVLRLSNTLKLTNTLRPFKNGWEFADWIFKKILSNWLSPIMWFQFQWNVFLGGPIHNQSTMGQVMAWSLTGDNPLPKPMLTKMCDTIWRQYAKISW